MKHICCSVTLQRCISTSKRSAAIFYATTHPLFRMINFLFTSVMQVSLEIHRGYIFLVHPILHSIPLKKKKIWTVRPQRSKHGQSYLATKKNKAFKCVHATNSLDCLYTLSLYLSIDSSYTCLETIARLCIQVWTRLKGKLINCFPFKRKNN